MANSPTNAMNAMNVCSVSRASRLGSLLGLGLLAASVGACGGKTTEAPTPAAQVASPSSPAAAAAGASTATSTGASAAAGAQSAQSVYDFSALPFRGSSPKSLKDYAGKVLLIANIASHCGFTPQMKPLAELERLYGPKGFKVLGFLSDDFGRQAGTDEEVSACNLEHGASFDEFAIVGVKKGASQAPLFAWLTSRPGLEGDVRWNFSKWLIDRQGKLVKRWGSSESPDSTEMRSAIEAELARAVDGAQAPSK